MNAGFDDVDVLMSVLDKAKPDTNIYELLNTYEQLRDCDVDSLFFDIAQGSPSAITIISNSMLPGILNEQFRNKTLAYRFPGVFYPFFCCYVECMFGLWKD